jgi:hypothetical protein
MRQLGLVLCLVFLAAAGADGATVKGRVVSRDPAKPVGPVNGFQVEVTQPGVGSPLHTSARQDLKPATDEAKSVDFTIDIPTLTTLGTQTEVVLTFTADGRTSATLELAGNQDQVLVLVLPKETPPPAPVEVVSCPCPCPTEYYVECCPPARHRMFGRCRR